MRGEEGEYFRQKIDVMKMYKKVCVAHRTCRWRPGKLQSEPAMEGFASFLFVEPTGTSSLENREQPQC